MKGRHLFFIAWGILFGANLYFLLKEDKIVRSAGGAIAKLTDKKGEAQFRPESRSIWSPAKVQQDFFDNDYLATLEGSEARVSFKDGRSIKLSENTQVVIRSKNANKDALEIELLHGNLTASSKGKDGKKANGIAIKAGEKTFKLKDEQAVLSLSHDRSQPEIVNIENVTGKVDMISDAGRKSLTTKDVTATKKPEPAPPPPPVVVASKVEEPDQSTEQKLDMKPVKKSPKPTTIALAKPIVAPEIKMPAPAPQAPEPVKPMELEKKDILKIVHATSYEPDIESPAPSSQEIIWSHAPIQAAMNTPLSFILTPPKEEPQDFKWRPILGGFGSALLGNNSNLSLKKVGEVGFKKQKINLTLQELEGAKLLKKINDSYPIFQFTLKPGVEIFTEEGKDSEFSFKEARSFEVRSLGDFGDQSVKLYLSNLKARKTTDNWITQNKNQKEDAKLYWIHLKTGKDLPKFGDLINGANNFDVENTKEVMGESGVFIVKNHKIIGSMGGIEKHKRGVDHILKTLDAEVIYRGSAKAYIGGLTELKDLIKQNGALPDRLYILNGGNFIGVSEEFLRKNPEVRKFLSAHTSAFFTEPIEVLSSKTDWSATSH